MPSYGFSFRASLRAGGGAGRLYLRVVHRGQSRSVTTEHRILPEEWDATRRRLIIPCDRRARSRELIEIERSLRGDLQRMERIIERLEREHPRGHDYTIDRLMERYRYLTSGNTLCAYTERLASGMEHNGCRRTARAYRSAAARLKAFNNGRDPMPEQLTPEFMMTFQQSLLAEGCNQNTASFYMRTLRAIYNKAVAEDRIARAAENPFVGVYTGSSPTRKRALSQTDLATLSALDPTLTEGRTEGRTADEVAGQHLPESLSRALAMFLFCYHARGMCFVDMANLKKADLQGNTIRYRRVKTGQTIELRVLPAMRRIIDWFAPRTVGSRYLFPVITDPTKDPSLQYESSLRIQNIRLKRIAVLCGITVRISTHCARHSWATVARNAGLSLTVISEALGHNHQRTTEIYLASLEQSVIDRASQMVSEAIMVRRSAKSELRRRIFKGTRSPSERHRVDDERAHAKTEPPLIS